MQSFFLCINKPRDVTTYDCVRAVRRIVGKKEKVGHGGTLDPFAEGLVIIAVGREATKHLGKLLGADKRYSVTMLLGTETDSYDTEGAVIKNCAYEHITRDRVQYVLESFKPGYEQTPPIYSALKVAGKPLYELARKGKVDQMKLADIAETKKRYIHLYDIEITEFKLPYVTCDAHVSTGTYVRSFVHDVGVRLGACATAVGLKRTQIGPFKLENAMELRIITSLDIIIPYSLSIEEFLQKLS
jgi:tRNA pseudouridine55 synthase